MALSEEARSVLKTAKALRRLADETLDRAYELTAQGEMSAAELRELKEDVYWPLRQVAGSLVLRQARIESERIAPHVDSLKQATSRLEKAAEAVERTGQVVSISVAALSIITSLLGAVLSPDSESLADVAKRIGELAGSIEETASDAKDE